MRRDEVADLAGVLADQVEEVSERDVRAALADHLPEMVLNVALQEPAFYWRAGGRYWLDDPMFGPPAPFDQLQHDPELGLVDGSQ